MEDHHVPGMAADDANLKVEVGDERSKEQGSEPTPSKRSLGNDMRVSLSRSSSEGNPLKSSI